MRKSTRTILRFDEDRLSQIKDLQKELSVDTSRSISNKEFFMIAAAFGFAKANRNEFVRTKNNGVRMEYFNANDEALFVAIASATFDSDQELLDVEATYDLAEQFASGGVILLSDALKKEKNFKIWFQSELFQQLIDSEILATQLAEK